MRGGAYLLKWNPVYATSRANRPASSSPAWPRGIASLKSAAMRNGAWLSRSTSGCPSEYSSVRQTRRANLKPPVVALFIHRPGIRTQPRVVHGTVAQVLAQHIARSWIELRRGDPSVYPGVSVPFFKFRSPGSWSGPANPLHWLLPGRIMKVSHRQDIVKSPRRQRARPAV
jgi:hypothetical protein